MGGWVGGWVAQAAALAAGGQHWWQQWQRVGSTGGSSGSEGVSSSCRSSGSSSVLHAPSTSNLRQRTACLTRCVLPCVLPVLQGTLYPDVIESCPPPGKGQKHSHTIKSHHNVGGLPEDLQFELIEPLRELFKVGGGYFIGGGSVRGGVGGLLAVRVKHPAGSSWHASSRAACSLQSACHCTSGAAAPPAAGRGAGPGAAAGRA